MGAACGRPTIEPRHHAAPENKRLNLEAVPLLWGRFAAGKSDATVRPCLVSVNATQRHPTHSGDRANRQWTVRSRFRWLLLAYTSNLRRCIVSTSSRGAR
jgi:hypothetical protein